MTSRFFWISWMMVAVLLSPGCVGRKPSGPDLAALYSPSAQHHGADRNPVIVIPGVMGSELVDASNDTVVWGDFTGRYANPKNAAGARLIALPMAEGQTLTELRDQVRPDGVLEQVQVSFLGIPLRISTYFQILTALGAGGYRDESLGTAGTIDYGDDHYTCFQFDYDWRRDIAESAARLAKFVEEKKAYITAENERRFGPSDREVRFDFVTHSMGSLVLRYYLRYGDAPLPEDGSLPPLTWAGAKNAETAILVGAPNAGSVLALRNLIEGVKPGPTIHRFNAAIIGTLPSAYQILPRTRHGGIVDAGPDGETPVDVYDPLVWEKRGWGLASTEIDRDLAELLPQIADGEERRRIARDHLRKSLRRADQFNRAIDVPASPPEHVALYLIAGDAHPTPSRATVTSDGEFKILKEAPGDRRVLRSSALMDERLGEMDAPRLISPIDWTHVMFLFQTHLGLTKAPEFTDNVLFLLLEKSRTRPGSGLNP